MLVHYSGNFIHGPRLNIHKVGRAQESDRLQTAYCRLRVVPGFDMHRSYSITLLNTYIPGGHKVVYKSHSYQAMCSQMRLGPAQTFYSMKMDLSWLPGRAESLNSGHVISLLAGVIIVWYVTSAIYVWYPLRHIPGPFLASFSHLWLATQHFRGEAYPALRGLAKYGSVVRIGPNRVLTDDPDALRRIAGLNSGYTRHRSYKDGTRFHREVDSMLGLLDEKAHSRIKAKTAAGYSGRDNPEFEKTVDREVERLLLLIRHKMLSTEQETRPVDFQALARFFALDALSSLAFGRPFGHLDNGEDLYGYVGAVARALRVLWLIRSLPVLRAMTFSDLTFQYFGPKPTDKSGPGRLMG